MSKQSFDSVWWNYEQFVGQYGLFWGAVTSQKAPQFKNYRNLTSPLEFELLEPYPEEICGRNNHLIVFCEVSSQLWVTLGYFMIQQGRNKLQIYTGYFASPVAKGITRSNIFHGK